MKLKEILTEIDRRGFLKGLGAAALSGAGMMSMSQSHADEIDSVLFMTDIFDDIADKIERMNEREFYQLTFRVQSHATKHLPANLHDTAQFVKLYNDRFLVKTDVVQALRKKADYLRALAEEARAHPNASPDTFPDDTSDSHMPMSAQLFIGAIIMFFSAQNPQWLKEMERLKNLPPQPKEPEWRKKTRQIFRRITSLIKDYL